MSNPEYRARAAECARDPANMTLANVRERISCSEHARLDMADRIYRFRPEATSWR